MLVAPSILSANFNNLLDEVMEVERANADFLHIDVMDGHFVPNISFGTVAYKNLRKHSNLVFDVHLMIEEPLKYAKSFIEAGADYLTFHYEACKDIKEAIKYIKMQNVKVGISIKPGTDVEVLKPFLSDIDLILVMSVEPGFGGQSFMESALGKIQKLHQWKKENSFKYLIEVDGGINLETALLCKENGCDVVVAGTYIFNASNKEEIIKRLKAL